MTMASFYLLLASSMFVIGNAATSDANCQLALGMESGAIMNRQLSSSSQLNVLQSPRFARLHGREGGGGWTAQTNNKEQYLEINLAEMTRVVAVATQGRYGSDDYTMKYKLEYSTDGNTWRVYMDNEQEKVFAGNDNAEYVKRNDLSNPIETRYIRFRPTQWNVMASMRVEVYGCLAGGDNTATFDGSAYIKYDISNPNNYIRVAEELIQFNMRTNQQDGIILASTGTQSDYIFLQLKQGKLVLSIDLGTSAGKSGATLLECGSLLDDNQWHFVRYFRKEKTIYLMVDGVTVSAKTNGYFKELNLDSEMTIGGTSNPSMPGLQVEQNFIGCLQNVALSNSANPQSLTDALYFIQAAKSASSPIVSVQGSLSYECRGGNAKVSATFPTQDAFLKWPGPDAGNSNFTVAFKFRTFDKNGLVIYNKLQTSGGGYIAVGLKDGTVNIAIKVADNPIIEIPGENKYKAAAVPPSSLVQQNSSTTQDSSPLLPNGKQAEVADTNSEGSGLADGRWHSVRAEVANNFVKLMVNGRTDPLQRNLNIRTGIDYFIGGSSETLENTGYMPGFRGCLQEVYLKDTMIDLLSIQANNAAQGVTNQDVDIDTCGLQDWCTPSPCEHGGQCLSDWDTFQCSCRGTGYSGATCHNTDVPRACESTGSIKIDVDGSGPLAPFDVDCVLDDEDGMLYSVVSHDAETQEDVPDGNPEPGSYMRDIMYGKNGEISTHQLKAFTKGAEYCEQYIKYECSGAKLLNSPAGPPYGWWVNVNNDKMNHWGGASPYTGKCQCGMDLSCGDPDKFCNCDADNTQDAVDDGLLMNKSLLPVTQLRFGDRDSTDRGDGSSSAAYQLGKLRCRGNDYADKVVTFQSDEAHLRFPVETTKQNALDVSLEFKTLAATGVVLLSADGPDDNFIQVELEDPTRLLFQVNYGAGPRSVRVTVNYDLDDDEWHSIKAALNSLEISLKVDQGLPEKQEVDSGNLNLQLTSDLFVGSSTLQSDGYVGCMRSLVINGESLDITSKTAQGVAMGCVGMCSEEQCLNEGTCEEFYDKFECQCADTPFEGEYCSEEIGVKMQSGSEISYTLARGEVKDYSEDVITLGFSTRNKQGMLLKVEGPNGEYEQISILPSGHLQYSLKLDASSEAHDIVSQHDFTDGRHHLVQISRTEKVVSLKVDLYKAIVATADITDTMLNGANNIIIGSTDSAKSFTGCISRVQFNGILPLKLYFGERPATMRGSGSIDKSRCGVEPEMPPSSLPPTPPPMEAVTTSRPTVPVAAQTGYKPGDKAAIAIVVLLLLLALILLVVFIGRYKYKHKGVYNTNEARGADNARDADTAVMMADTKQPKFEKKKEWYI